MPAASVVRAEVSTLAHIEDRWEKVVDGQRVRTPRFGTGSRWRARYLDPRGHERSQCFGRRIDAERFLASVETTKLQGTYVDPDAGRQQWFTHVRLAVAYLTR